MLEEFLCDVSAAVLKETVVVLVVVSSCVSCVSLVFSCVLLCPLVLCFCERVVVVFVCYGVVCGPDESAVSVQERI